VLGGSRGRRRHSVPAVVLEAHTAFRCGSDISSAPVGLAFPGPVAELLRDLEVAIESEVTEENPDGKCKGCGVVDIMSNQ
jgi:hypothetical protein